MIDRTARADTGKYRRDIDGLRAVAVASVVLYHAASRLIPSGFVGVDIFFVISGYLIGGIVFGETLDKRFSFADFYARRARRILPALVALIGFVSVVAIFFFDRQELIAFAGQAAMALTGVSNVYFWQHTDYFATASDREPLLMTWSLGVEEQFYIVFPFLMFGVTRLGRHVRLLAVLLAVAVSLALSLYLTHHAPITAFYMLPPRAWEMGAGAALAIVHHDAPHTARAHNNGIEALGIASAVALVVSLVAFDGRTPFPGVAALLPVLATVGIIAARSSTPNRLLLSARPFVFVGQISYSWYLWHWPLMALARRATDVPPSEPQMLAIAALSFLLGWLSWRFVERPFRKSVHTAGPTLLRYAVVLCAALALPVLFKLSSGWPSRLPATIATVEQVQLEGRGDCLVPYGAEHLLTDAACAPADASIALLGDSHASAFGPGLIASARQRGRTVAQFAKSACLPLPGFPPVDPLRPDHQSQCRTFLSEAGARILANPAIRLVVVAGAWPRLAGPDPSGASLAARPNAFVELRDGLDSLAYTFRQAGKRVVIVGDVPSPGFAAPDHLVGEALPLRRLVGRTLDGDRRAAAGTFPIERADTSFVASTAALRRIAGNLGVQFVDPTAQLCTGSVCRYADGATPLYYDSNHLSAAGSRTIDWGAVLDGTTR